MFTASLKFNSIPKIGFANHFFYTDKYVSTYAEEEKSLEIVYVQSGCIIAELFGETFLVPEGSIFVLFRHLPLKLSSIDNMPQSHCTVQAKFDYDFRLIHDDERFSGNDGMILPFVTLPCPETEIIKKKLYSIVSDIGIYRDENALSCSIQILDIMRILAKLAQKNNAPKASPGSNISYKVKKYVANNIDKYITLTDISDALKLTPGYINHVFKDTVGLPIIQYINREKTKKISELIRNQKLSFKAACLNVGIEDLSYGYRLFKKHMGSTPNEFLSVSRH